MKQEIGEHKAREGADGEGIVYVIVSSSALPLCVCVAGAGGTI